MYLPWNLLFKTPFSNNAVNVIMVIPCPTFLYYQLFNLLCGPTCVALLQDTFYPVFYLSGNLWMSTTPYLVLQSFWPFLSIPFQPLRSPTLTFVNLSGHMGCDLTVIYNVKNKQHPFLCLCILLSPVNPFKCCPVGNSQTLYRMIVEPP